MNQYLLIQFLEGWTSIYIHLPAIFMFTSGTMFWPTAISTCSTWGLVARGRSAKRWISSIHLRWSSWAMSCESLGFGARWVLLRLVCPKMGCTMIYHDIPPNSSLCHELFPIIGMAVLGMPVLYPHSWANSTSDNMSIQQSARRRGLAWQNGELWKGHLVIYFTVFAACKKIGLQNHPKSKHGLESSRRTSDVTGKDFDLFMDQLETTDNTQGTTEPTVSQSELFPKDNFNTYYILLYSGYKRNHDMGWDNLSVKWLAHTGKEQAQCKITDALKTFSFLYK